MAARTSGSIELDELEGDADADVEKDGKDRLCREEEELGSAHCSARKLVLPLSTPREGKERSFLG